MPEVSMHSMEQINF